MHQSCVNSLCGQLRCYHTCLGVASPFSIQSRLCRDSTFNIQFCISRSRFKIAPARKQLVWSARDSIEELELALGSESVWNMVNQGVALVGRPNYDYYIETNWYFAQRTTPCQKGEGSSGQSLLFALID